MTNDEAKNGISPETFAAQAGGVIASGTGDIVAPIHVTTTYLRDPDNQYRSGLSYGRDDNPNMLQCEAVLAALEGGDRAFVFSSGMAAAVSLFFS